MKPVQCNDLNACDTHENERVELVGTYAVWARGPNDKKSRQVRIVLDADAAGPFLEQPRDARHKRAPEEIERFRNRRVRVVGTYHAMIPQTDEAVAQLAGPYLENVELIELVE